VAQIWHHLSTNLKVDFTKGEAFYL